MVECKNLPGMDPNGKTYVKVYIMPGIHPELKTKIIKNNQTSVFNEDFKLEVGIYSLIQSKSTC